MTREGYIFVIVDDLEDDVFVKASKTMGALNGDTVRVAVTKEKIADDVIPTVPGKASTSADGLMSKEDKSKLDGVAANANAYVLPAATTSALGGVKQAAHVDGSDGTAIVAALVAAGIMAAS